MRLGADLVVNEELEAGLEVATRVLRRCDVGPAEVQGFVETAVTSAGHAGLCGDFEAVLAEAEERIAPEEDTGAGTLGEPGQRDF